jgi:hypothetical protein
VESVPGSRSGAWVFRDTRIPVATVFENLEAGASIVAATPAGTSFAATTLSGGAAEGSAIRSLRNYSDVFWMRGRWEGG